MSVIKMRHRAPPHGILNLSPERAGKAVEERAGSGEDPVEVAKRLRPKYQLALLGWIRGEDANRHLRTLGSVAEAELEWLVAHGVMRHFEPGDFGLRAGADLSRVSLGLEVVLSGRMSTHVDRGAGERKVMEWQAGDLTGIVPFSRMTVASGNTIADTSVDTLSIAPGIRYVLLPRS